ncbi:sterol desaturase family protein [Gallaecimonas kandeliae]|uniref:sterol desaturase family protein n=1 Tax=Gallaecimonas kandeliae TaxID=3029055 RepID=UPI00264753D2|nr:sterol desaturase family protein [Gallaecimonas kandeliae]WKE66824.1 sterol desaturase family protein [Gallaecimonas kandeliae]
MDNLLLLLMAPIFIGMVFFEQYQHPERYQKREWLQNFLLAGSYQLAEYLMWFPALLLYRWLYEHRLFELPAGPWAFLALCIAQDFLYYWFHRCSHRCHWLWAAHVVHHSSEQLNYSTALRQSLFYPLVGMWLFWAPLAWLGFAPAWIVMMVALNLAFQFFIHSPSPRRWGFLESWLNTPSHHRVHHAQNPDYLDRNFAGVLIIWDKMFGTFTPENEPCRYGVVKAPADQRFWTVLTHEFAALLDEMKKAPSWKGRLFKLLNKPY